MSVKLNEKAFAYAAQLIKEGKVKLDERDDWSEDQPTAKEENEFIEKHGFKEYGKWFLGINEKSNVDTKERYEFPYGDFKEVHRGGIISAESRAGQYKHYDIESAAKKLLALMGSKD